MDGIGQVRSFNRVVTRQIGALDAGFLGRNRSLGACRVLFEIGAAGLEIRQLRARLGLDSGYTSRLLRQLEGERLIRLARSPRDPRARLATLTPAGRRELAVLDQLSDDAAAALLEPLPGAQRAALLAAMGTIERLLQGGAVRLSVEHPDSPAARSCLTSYFAELATRFARGFDPARSIPASGADLTPPRGYFVLATLHGEPVGCGALKCHAAFGEIKRMWVAPAARGLGIGTRILLRLEALARQRRLPRLRLETNKTLTEAQALYRGSGFQEVPAFNDEPYAHHWFEKVLPRLTPSRSSARGRRP
jgi:DNA-binding MarR family transcriptional regulator/GNAT superfamily N-acetyltransferase